MSNDIDIVYDTDKTVLEVKENLNEVDLKKYEEFSLEVLCMMYQKGDLHVIDLIYNKVEKLIGSRVMKYIGHYKNNLCYEDLLQYGYFGLYKAIKKFDITRGNNFSTYAVFWIDQVIRRAIETYGFSIRIPAYKFNELNKILSLLNNNENRSEFDFVYDTTFLEKNSIDIKTLMLLETVFNPYSLNFNKSNDPENGEVIDPTLYN